MIAKEDKEKLNLTLNKLKLLGVDLVTIIKRIEEFDEEEYTSYIGNLYEVAIRNKKEHNIETNRVRTKFSMESLHLERIHLTNIRTNQKRVVVPEGIDVLGWGNTVWKDYANNLVEYKRTDREKNENVEILILPKSLMYIDYEVKFGDSLYSSMFPNLREVIFNEDSILYGFPEYLMAGLPSLEKVLLPKSLGYISDSCFNSSSIQSIKLPENVLYIYDSAFSYCTSLVNIDLNEGLIEIGQAVFRGCSSLKSIVIPSTVTCIDYDTFKDCRLDFVEVFGDTNIKFTEEDILCVKKFIIHTRYTKEYMLEKYGDSINIEYVGD